MNLPSKERILAEAVKLHQYQNLQVDSFNTPEREELQEAGLLVEARNKLMRTATFDEPPPPSRVICYTADKLLNVREVNKNMKSSQEWAEEWKKKDPYLQDTEGYMNFLEEKAREVPVEAIVDVYTEYGGGYTVWLQIPWKDVPEEHRQQPDKDKTEQLNKWIGDLTKALEKLGFRQRAWSRIFDGEDNKWEYPEGTLVHGSTNVFQYHPLDVPEPTDMKLETEEDLARYIEYRMNDYGIFSYDDMNISETVYNFTGNKGKQVPNDSLARGILEIAIDTMDKCEAAARAHVEQLILTEVEKRIGHLKEGMWYYYGDEAHEKDENIRRNARIMWKIWSAVGSQIPNCIGLHKDYDMCSLWLYLRHDAETCPALPPFHVSRTSMKRHLRDSFSYNHEIHLLETEEPDKPIYTEMETIARAILIEGVPNTEDIFEDDYEWVLPENEPMILTGVPRTSLSEVMEALSKGKLEWEPEQDYDIMRNGGLDIVHPYLRQSRVFTWNKDSIIWSEAAEIKRQMYNTIYTREELEQKTVAELRVIVSAKGAKPDGTRKEFLVEAVLAHSSIWKNH